MYSPKPIKKVKTRKGFKPRVDRELAIWANSVKARDFHICQRCGHFGDHAHHIAPRGRAPHLRLDIGNGITLCFPCHHWVHSHVAKATAAGFLRSA